MRTKVDLAKYLHLCAWSPVVDTWLNAIDRYFFLIWPGFSSQLIKKHLPKSITIAKGHLKVSRQHVRSTKHPTAPTTLDQIVMTNAAPPSGPHFQTKLVTIKCIDLTGKNATDQTGRFPVTSSRGNKYVMAAYAQDSNMILAEPIKSRSTAELLRAYNTI